MKWRILAGLVLAGIAAAFALHARDPVFWGRYLALLGSPAFELSPEHYAPRERIAGREEPRPPAVTPEEESLERAALEAAADYAGAHGSRALIVSRGGHIVFERYWQGTGFDTVVDARELAATLTALAVGIAIGEGRIRSLDEPVASFLTEWRDDARGAITVRQLLNMSSGLAPSSETLLPWSDGVRERLGSDIAAVHLRRPLAGTPGETWAYKRSDPQLLALILERATGMRFAEYLSDRLWRRLGAADAEVWIDRPAGYAHATCCLLARQGDWIRLGQALADDGVYLAGELLPPGWVRRMREPAPGFAGFGMQVWLGASVSETDAGKNPMLGRAAEPFAADDAFFLAATGGHRLWVVPSLRIAILRTGGGAPARSDWDETRIPNLVIRAARDHVPEPAPGSGIDPAQFVPGH